jgi:hypothetical protein
MHGLAVLLLRGLFDPGSSGLWILFHALAGDLAHAELELSIGVTSICPGVEFTFIHTLLGRQHGGEGKQAGQKEERESHGVNSYVSKRLVEAQIVPGMPERRNFRRTRQR